MNERLLNQLQKLAGDKSIPELLAQHLRPIDVKNEFYRYHMDRIPETTEADWENEKEKFIERQLLVDIFYTFDNGANYFMYYDVENFAFDQSCRQLNEIFVLYSPSDEWPE